MSNFKQKVLAYITRERNGKQQLLVFDHRDHPDAGTQVPAGTVEGGELVEVALWREVWEELGLTVTQLRLERKLAEHPNEKWNTVRHVYHLTAFGELPGKWTHIVRGLGGDNGMAFEYRWEALPLTFELAGKQGVFHDLID